MLKFINVDFSYPNRSRILEGISLEVESGEKVAIMGGNGAGKSTLAQLMAGLLPANSGTITLDGTSVYQLKRDGDLPKRIQIVFQNPDDQIINYDVEREIAFGLENLAVPRREMVERVDKILEEFGLTAHRHRSPNSLSGGEKQKLCLASAMVMSPDYLILDEPTSYLDSKSQMEILWKILNRKDMAIILITADLADALLCDRVLILKDGKIAFDGKSSNLLNESLQEYGMELSPRFRLIEQLKNDGVAIDFSDGISVERLIEKLVCLRE
jgi:energy-coupling factor transport system ATP-binding protein